MVKIIYPSPESPKHNNAFRAFAYLAVDLLFESANGGIPIAYNSFWQVIVSPLIILVVLPLKDERYAYFTG